MSLLPTEKSKRNVDLSKIRMLIYGPPKVGKTTLCAGFPDALILATEKGYGAHEVYAKDIAVWSTFIAVVDELTTKKHQFKTVIIDTADILFKLCVELKCKELGITHISDEDWGKGYDIVANEFEKQLNKLFMSNLGIIMISHTKIIDLNSRTGKLSKVVPTLSNQARRIIIPKVSVVGVMKLKTIKTERGTFEERRVISFKPSELEEAGDRDGCLPEELVAYKDPSKTYALFSDCYKKGGGINVKVK